MGLTDCRECKVEVNEKGRELAEHGSVLFPCGCYSDNMTVYGVPWHWHEEIELVIVSRGTAQIIADQRRFILSEGEAAFINSNVLHAAANEGSGECLIYSLVFMPRLVYGSTDSVFWQRYIYPLTNCRNFSGMPLRKNIAWQSQAAQMIETAHKICVEESYGFEFTVRELLSKICLLVIEGQRELLAQKSVGRNTETERIKTMLDFIHLHYSETVGLERIAVSANISERECLRCFKETIGSSPIQYLIRYRISAAARLLREENLNITELCASCGFESPSYFSKLFKQIMHCSPSEYRKKNG